MRNPLRHLRRTPSATAGDVTAVRGAGAAPDRSTLRSRKRFARRQWRRRWLAWKYVVVLAVLLVAVVVGVYAVYFSSWLSVKSIDAQVEASSGPGVQRLTADQVATAADVPTGRPLARVDLSQIATRVRGLLPAALSVDVSREWPDKIRIVVTERTPVAVIDIGGRLHALDTNGQIFFGYRQAPPGLPSVRSTSTDQDALAQGAQVAASLPADLARQVDHVQIATRDNIRLQLHNGKSVVWGSAADSAAKAQVLVALMKAQPSAAAYDVSVPGSPTAG